MYGSEFMKKHIYLLCILYLILSPKLLSQLYEVDIESIHIGSVSIPIDKELDIVISDKDSLTFKYQLSKNSVKTTSPFFYKVVLVQNDYSAPRTSGATEITYSKLQEGNYKFEVYAFDLNGKWVSSVTKVLFRVNNKEAELVKKLAELEKEKIISDKTIDTLTKTINDNSALIEKAKLGVIIAGIVLFVSVMLILMFNSRLNKQKKIAKKNKSDIENHLKKINTLEQQVASSSKSYNEVEQLKNKIEVISKKVESIFELNSNFSNSTKFVQVKSTELEKLQSKKNGMFTDILNGINSPMNVIKSLVELLRNYDFNANETQDIVNNIIDTTKKIIHISEDVQRFIELEVSDININIDTADVNLLISEAVNKNIDEIKRKNITMKINIAPEVTTIKLDAQKITIVLHNLINNAVKFTNNNGKISINCYPKNNSVIFEVADTGIGIDQEDLKKIYENMEASDCLAISNNNGTIGLLIVKKYIEAHNGNVLVSSVLGKGSTFSFNVPLNIN